jgi:hypothetical protein
LFLVTTLSCSPPISLSAFPLWAAGWRGRGGEELRYVGGK